MIHPADEEALQTIDAAVFTGDPDVIRERLTYFIERWQKALKKSTAFTTIPGSEDLPYDDEPCRECGEVVCYCPDPHPPGGIPG